jgi:PTS system ascorbate-specific IIA component
MLSDFITPEVINVQVSVKDWREAVEAGGDLLLKAGKCEPRYIDAMVSAVETMGPYMVIAPGLALAHARPQDGTLAVGASIVTLATPVEFGSEANDPVKLVISFCAVDKDSHIEMLKEIATFLGEESNQELLTSAATVDDVMKAFASA